MTRLILCLLFFAIAAPARAMPPVPQSKAQALKDVEKNLKAQKDREAELATQLKSIEKELSGTRAQLVDLATDIQQTEKNLVQLEERIAVLSEEKDTLTKKLEGEYGSMAGLVLALERMRRVPPESLIVRPGAPLETAQTAMLLKSTLPAVKARAEQVSADLRRLGEMTTNLEQDRTDALESRKALLAKQDSMKSLIAKRETLHRSTQGDLDRNKARVAALAREAKTLQDLITRLQREEERRKAEPPPPAKQAATAKIYGGSLPPSGAPRLPVAGKLVEVFGKPNAIGATSQGLTIESRPGALVVAPMGGVVRFAGAFKNYGKMVIIEHQDGYHSLIGGLDSITTNEDSRLNPGEPVGQLSQTPFRGGGPTLYYELRYKGQPVNPADRISELKS